MSSWILCAGNSSAAGRRPKQLRLGERWGETGSMSVSDRTSVERIVVELETPGDSRSLFRLRLDNKVVGENLTAVQAHLLIGEILDRITLPRPFTRDGERDWALESFCRGVAPGPDAHPPCPQRYCTSHPARDPRNRPGGGRRRTEPPYASPLGLEQLLVKAT